MAGPKKRRGRAAPEKFYRDLNGEYQYGGAVYRYCGDPPRARALARMWAVGGGMAAALAAAGCLGAAGTDGCFYVLLPYAGCFVAAFSAVWALVRLTAAGGELRDYVYEATVQALPGRAALTAALAAAAMAGEGVYLLRHGFEGRPAATLAYAALLAAGCAAALRLRRSLPAESWQRQENGA